MVRFKHHFTGIADLLEHVEKFLPINASVTGNQMIVAIMTVIVLNVER